MLKSEGVELLESFFDIISFRFFVRDVNLVSNVILRNSVSLDFGQNKNKCSVRSVVFVKYLLISFIVNYLKIIIPI